MSTNTLGHRLRPSLVTGLTASGASQATAFPLLNNTLHEFTTVAGSAGAILPVGVTPSEISIFNGGASSLSIYPPAGGSIDGGTANASVALAAGSGATFWASNPSNWYHLVSGPAAGGTPGGTSGQVQYNNVGTFGGFTASGDATINTSTGAVTVTSTNGTPFAPSATTDTTNASNIGSGTLPAGRLPSPTASTLGGIESVAGVPHQWIASISTSGVPALSQPGFSDLSGAATIAQLPTIATHTTLANTTGGTAAPAGVTLTALIDATIDNTPGDLLYRGSSAWSALTPGSAGAILYSGGAAASPAWTTNILRGTDGNLNFAGITHGTPAAGDLWYPSSDQGTFAIGRASGAARLGGCIFSCGSCNAVANTASATSIFGSPTNSKGSLTIPANTLAVGNLLRWYMSGIYSCTSSTPTIQFDYYLNGTDILVAWTAATFTAAKTNSPFFTELTSWMSVLAIGASASATGFAGVSIINSSTLNAQSVPGGTTPAGSTTFASNANALFDIKATWSAASTSNSFQVTSFALFLDN